MSYMSMFENVQSPVALEPIVERIREVFRHADFYKMGAIKDDDCNISPDFTFPKIKQATVVTCHAKHVSFGYIFDPDDVGFDMFIVLRVRNDPPRLLPFKFRLQSDSATVTCFLQERSDHHHFLAMLMLIAKVIASRLPS